MSIQNPFRSNHRRTTVRVNLSLLLMLLICLGLLAPAFPSFPRKVRTVVANIAAKLLRRKPMPRRPELARQNEESEEREEHEEKEGHFDSPDEAAEYFRQKRLPKGMNELPLERYLAAQEHMRNMRTYSTALASYAAADSNQVTALGGWNFLGPGNVGGRTRALVINPNNPDILYAGGVAGGVWKTTNGGAAWTPVSDLIANLAVTDLAFDPANPNILYAATGESYSSAGVRGLGIFKTTDGGVTWTHLTNTANADFHFVSHLVVSPLNSQRVYASTTNGVFRSLDGGANWVRVLNQTRCDDLIIRTNQANDYLFAACRVGVQGTIYRNTNAQGAGTWDQVFTEAGMGRVALALAPSSQNVIYAIAESNVGGPGGNYNGGLHAVFRSSSSGDTGSWTATVRNTNANKLNTLLLTNVGAATQSNCGGGADAYFNQGWYDMDIAVDPVNPNRVWVGGVDVFRSDDSGANWGYVPALCAPHVDQHVIVFHPQYNGTTNQTIFLGNDGGLYKSVNANAPVRTGTPLCGIDFPCRNFVGFVTLNNNYGVTQFYHGLPYPNGETFFGGTQDNSTNRGTLAGGPYWSSFLGGDGGYVAVDPANTNVLYAEIQNLNIHKSTDGGANWTRSVNGIANLGFRFIVPFMMDPTNAQRLWTGGAALWRTDNGAANWVQASTTLNGSVSALSVSKVNNNRALAGTESGFIYRNDNANAATGGTSWLNTQPRGGYLSWLTHDPINVNVAYATYSTFGGTHVWKSVDGGTTWTGLDGTAPNNLPDVPVHCLVVDPANSQRLYVGTDVGVFSSLDGGATWAQENTGFANVITEALAINDSGDTRALFAFTHGRGVWRVVLSGLPGCPTATSVAPALAGPGSSVVINGSRFVGVSEVRFSNGVSAAFSIISDNKLQVSIPAGATTAYSGPLTIRKPGCADVTTPTLTVCSNPADLLLVDDGSHEYSDVGRAGWIFANRLTPSGYPATLTQVVANINLPPGTAIDILVGANTDGDTNINGTAFTVTATAVTVQQGFGNYNVPPLSINSGDFVVGYRHNLPGDVFSAPADTTLPTASRSYASQNNGANFNFYKDAFNPANDADLLIRGTVIVGSCTNNTAPAFTPAVALTRQQGSPAGAAVQVGNVNDAETPVGNLVVTQIAGGTATGINVTSIVNTNGVITAQVSAACNATAGTVRFQVSDGSLTGTGNLQVNVSANIQPTLTYNNASATTGTATTVSPATGPSDNGSISSIVVQSVTPSAAPGTITVNNTTGVVSVPNNVPAGTYTVTIRATDNCSAVRDASFTLTVATGNTTPTFTPAAALSPQQGSPAGAAVHVGTVSDAQTAAGNLVVTRIAGGTATGINVTGISNANGVITAQVEAVCNAAPGTIRFQVSDGTLTGIGDLQINVMPNTPPIFSYNNNTVVQGGAVFVFPAAGPGDNGTINGIAVQSLGTYAGGFALATGGTIEFSNANPAGTHTITIRATDNCGAVRDASFTLTVTCQTITLTNPGVTTGNVGAAFSQTFTQTGGFGTTNFSTASTLPAGLSLSATGVLSGTPTQIGTFPIIVKATDSSSCMGTSATYTLVISAAGGSGMQFFPLPQPVRLLETRAGLGGCTTPGAPINAGGTFTLPARTACAGIPGNAAAVTGNITVVPSGAGFLTLFPSSATQPTVANSNFRASEVTNNVFTIGLGAGDGAFKIFASATTHVIVDVTGYYAPPGTGGLYFHPLPKPIRLLETRAGQTGCDTPGAPLQAGDAGIRTQQARVSCDGVTIPSDALAIVGNATTVAPQGAGFLTLFPANAARPLVAASNYNAGQIVNGPFSVGLAPTGEFKLYSAATTELVVDVLGYYSAAATDANGAGLLFTPLAHPVRLLETRAGQTAGCFLPGAPLTGGVEATQGARGTCDGVTIPANALGVVGNATVVFPSGPGFLTLWPSTAARPLVATSNYNPGDVGNRHFILGLGSGDGAFKLFSAATTNLVLDLAGYFAP